MSALRPLLLAACILSATLPAQQDTILLKKGAPIRARVWDEGPAEVTCNRYFTGIRKVTHGTERVPAGSVKKIIPDADPHRRFWNQAENLKPGTADEWCALGQEALDHKLKGLATHAFVEALVRDPAHEGARKGLGAKAKELLASDPRLNAALREKVEAWLKIEDGGAREDAVKEIQKLGGTWPAQYLERAWRSARQPKGRTEQRMLTFRSAEHKGTYCLFVPASYDPFRPAPLLVGLHGGGRGGKDGKLVVGTGESAMNFYQSDAEARGFLVVCPTAIEAPWAARPNDGFLLAVVEEVCLLFNVDRNRIYLTGHSMGGFGAWHFGPKYAHLWAAIAPMAGGGSPELKVLEETRTGVYVYHGTDDPVVGAGTDRAIAEQMRQRGMDFVYAEIPDAGHGFPSEVADEMWRFFAPRRLAAAPDFKDKGPFTITQEPRSSFLDRPTKEEIRYFGPLGKGEDPADGAPELAALVADLKLGGGLAAKAGEKLAATKDPRAVPPLARILADPKAGKDSRRIAAETLGRLGLEAGVKPLLKALGDEDLAVLGAAGWALGQIGLPAVAAGGIKALDRGTRDLKTRFDTMKTGDRWEFSDFEAYLGAAARLAEGLGGLKDPGGSAVLGHLAEAFLLPRHRVDASDRAGENPDVPRRHLARAVVAALGAIADPGARPLLETLAARTEFGVQSEVQEILDRLGPRDED